MSAEPIIVSAVSSELARRAHRWAIASGKPAAYARSDRALRRQAGKRWASRNAGRARGASDPWFEFRWHHGEAQAAASQATVLAERANLPPAAPLLAKRVFMHASSAVGTLPFAWCHEHPEGDHVTVLAHPDTSAEVLVLGVLVARLRSVIPLGTIPLRLRTMVLWHCAGSALVTLPAMHDQVEILLESAARVLLPGVGETEGFIEAVLSLEPLVDQPPGEVSRLAAGMAAKRIDRMHRAWLRRLFAPREFDLDAWVARQT